MYRRVLIASLALITAIFFPVMVFAQGAGVLSMRPAKVETTVAPGERAETALTIENGTPNPLLLTVTFEDVEPTAIADVASDPATLLGERSGLYPLREWMSSPKRGYEVLSGETIRIPISVTVPKGALPGGRYGSAVILAKPALDIASGGSENLAFETRIAALYFVRVSGDAKEEGILRSFGSSEGSVLSSHPGEPTQFFISYENFGDVHLNPYGGIRITSMFGEDRELVVEPWAVYPKSTRTRDIVLSGELVPGIYHATLELNRGYADIVDTASVRFIVLPGVREALFFAVVVLVLLMVVRKSLRLSRNRVM